MPSEPVRSMSGTERAVSSPAARSSSLISSEGSRSHKLTSALEHNRMLELPEIAVDGTVGISGSGGLSSVGLVEVSGAGSVCGDSGNMQSSSSGSWQRGL